MLWQVSHKVIKLSGELPPVFRDSRWWTFKTLSFDLPLQYLHLWLSLYKTYSRTFQKSDWTPCWYSAPFISGFFIFWISKLATSTTIFPIGKNLCSFAMSVKWHSSFDFIDGGSHFSVRFRFENLAFLYRNFLERRVRLVSLRVDKFSTKSVLSSALHSKRTWSFVVIDNPIFS